MNQHFIAILCILLLVAFSIYRRIRRNIGWQELNTRKLVTRTIIFLVIGLIFLSGALTHPISLISDFVGIAIGAFLAFYGAGLTHYEVRGQKWYFQPNVWIGSLVTVLFLGRMMFRFYKIYEMGLMSGNGITPVSPPNDLNQMNMYVGNSWSSGLVLIMFAYYVVYFILILLKEKKLKLSTEITQ
ncbi:hypothetical protein [Neobacillus sp. D3-1R]|uniref:hypothetical protein n=1 Tax=Neobacillus sp. D3-1R TaxID=3445778 RepID=UPI003FA10BFE